MRERKQAHARTHAHARKAQHKQPEQIQADGRREIKKKKEWRGEGGGKLTDAQVYLVLLHCRNRWEQHSTTSAGRLHPHGGCRCHRRDAADSTGWRKQLVRTSTRRTHSSFTIWHIVAFYVQLLILVSVLFVHKNNNCVAQMIQRATPATRHKQIRLRGETQRSLVCDHQLLLWCTNGNFCKVKQVPEQQTAESLAKVLHAAGEHWGLNRKRTACHHGNTSIIVGVSGLLSFRNGSKYLLHFIQPIYCVGNCRRQCHVIKMFKFKGQCQI